MYFFLFVIILFILLTWGLEVWSGLRTLRALDPRAPEEFQGEYDRDRYARAQAYARENVVFDMFSETAGTVAVLLFILLGGFPALDGAARSLGLGPLPTGLVFFVLLGLLSDIGSTPFSLYQTFVIEQRYGFNKTTVATYVKDKLKGWGLAVVIGLPVLAGVLFFFQSAGHWGWFWAWLAVTLIMLALQYAAPVWILPLFNKFTPLEDGSLRRGLEEFAKRQGYALSGIFVVDGSRRSAKANAFLAGFGKAKRIGLFDTLLDEHPDPEVEAVLAHEVGHHKLGHVLKLTGASILRTLAMFWLLSLFLWLEPLHQAFGMQEPTVYAGLVFFGLLFTPVNLLLGVAFNAASRRFEFQADRFAAEEGPGPQPMITALKRLAKKNFANLTPDKLNVTLHYSHPPILERIRALREAQPQR